MNEAPFHQITPDGHLLSLGYAEWVDRGAVDEVLEALCPWDFAEFTVTRWVYREGERYSDARMEFPEETQVSVAYPRGNAEGVFYWREHRSPFNDEGEARRKGKEENAEERLLSSLSSLCSMRLAPPLWRALAGNPVVHFQFGPMVAVASDGARILLLDRAKLGEREWAVVHRTNVIGPATATPTSPSSWDWVRNCPKGQRSAAVKKTPTQKAEELLQKLQQQRKT